MFNSEINTTSAEYQPINYKLSLTQTTIPKNEIEKLTVIGTLYAAANKSQESPQKPVLSTTKTTNITSPYKTNLSAFSLSSRLQEASDKNNSCLNSPTKYHRGPSSSSSFSQMPPFSLPTPNDFEETETQVTYASNSPQKRAHSAVSSSLITPTAPQKRRAVAGRASAPVSPFVTLYEQAIERQAISFQGQSFRILKFGQPGTYMQSFEIIDEKEMFEGVKNEALLVKLYHTGSNYKKNYQPTALEHSLKNYNFYKEMGVNVATIYNATTATIDKVFVVELIPNAIDINNPSHIEAANLLFRRFFIELIPMDLCYPNLRVTDSGVVTLIDYLEEPISFEKKSQIRDYTTQFLKSWVLAKKNTLIESPLSIDQKRDQAEKLLKDLTKGVPAGSIPQEWVDGALDEHFVIVNTV